MAHSSSAASHAETGSQAGRQAESRSVGWDQLFPSRANPHRRTQMRARLSTSAGWLCATPTQEPLGMGKEDSREQILGSNSSQGVEGGVEESPE